MKLMFTSRNSQQRSIISYVEFHLVRTSRISSLLGRWAASQCRSNFSRFCGDARTLTTSLRSYNNI